MQPVFLIGYSTNYVEDSVLSGIALLIQLAGIVCIALAYRERNRDLPFISFKNPIDPRKLGLWFRTVRGYRLAVAGGLLLSAGALIGVVVAAFRLSG